MKPRPTLHAHTSIAAMHTKYCGPPALQETMGLPGEKSDHSGGARWITHHRDTRRDVLGHYRPGSHHSALADSDARKDCCVGTDRRTLFDERREQLGRRIARTGLEIVGEGYVRSDEDVILQRQAVPELNAAFDRDAVADDDLVLDEAMRADVPVAADDGARQDHHVLPDASAFADLLRLHVRTRMNEHGE